MSVEKEYILVEEVERKELSALKERTSTTRQIDPFSDQHQIYIYPIRSPLVSHSKCTSLRNSFT